MSHSIWEMLLLKRQESVKLFEVSLDNELKFSAHISKLCKKGNQKVHAIARISKYLSEDKL